MKKGIGIFLVLAMGFSTGAMALTYFGYDEFGGTWHDAEKSPTDGDDNLMCWAAAAANVLTWTGWDAGFAGTDAIFAHFQDHSIDTGGYTSDGYQWWFDGVDQWWVDTPGGGGFYPTENWLDYYHGYSADVNAMPEIAGFLHEGYGVAFGIRPPGTGGHAITAWGYEYDAAGDILGIYVTDSDDDKGDATPPDVLAYYDVYESGGKWYLDDFYGSDWWIDDVWAFDRNLEDPQPTPDAGATFLLLGLAAMGMGIMRKKV